MECASRHLLAMSLILMLLRYVNFHMFIIGKIFRKSINIDLNDLLLDQFGRK